MISDVLWEAEKRIENHLQGSVYGEPELRAKILAVLQAMRALREELDAPPTPEKLKQMLDESKQGGEAVTLYDVCPACGSKRRTTTPYRQIFICQVCDAIYGDCSPDPFPPIVKVGFSTKRVPFARLRAFDFTAMDHEGRVSRTHGWYDHKTGELVQSR